MPAEHATQEVVELSTLYPGGQAEQDVALLELIEPVGHKVQLLEPDAELNVPAGQSEQEDAPIELPFVPAGQLKQLVDPETGAYFPIEHGTQEVLASLGILPAGHAEQVVAPIPEIVPLGQLMHVVPALLGMNVPAGQLVQDVSPISAAIEPGPHGEQDLLFELEINPAGHDVQLLLAPVL